jgi:hypothetical protein
MKLMKVHLIVKNSIIPLMDLHELIVSKLWVFSLSHVR